ncbi:proteinase B [Entomophthora muscae]|uniref:Proteinase B n=1 Tax=Entomophthora muscae TaxID=34485 RepID=A0ACC2UP04_9FUNG|nr:proteinase B [Entomophthora muscae]
MHFFSIVLAVVASRSLEDSYIIKLKGQTRVPIQAHLSKVKSLFNERSNRNEIRQVYKSIGNMYNARFSRQVLNQVERMHDVEYIRKDKLFSINAVQQNATWGLNRISQFEGLSGPFKDFKYNYTLDGAGTTVYVLDTGIMVEHPEFEGRARFGARFAGTNDKDEHGHGTHCAGTVGSRSYGVAKKASLVAVRVLDATGYGATSEVIGGIDWAVGDAKGSNGSVISMSLGGEKEDPINDAVEAAVASGVIVVVAAGNEDEDACMGSPSSSPSAITVGASDAWDMRADFSNYGKCVDVFAPGVDILSTWNNGKTKSISGTSMATPHVAGLAAYFLSESFESPEAIVKKIIDHASKDLLTDIGPNSPNLLINNKL